MSELLSLTIRIIFVCTEINFVEVSKNLARYKSENIFFIDYQDNWKNKA